MGKQALDGARLNAFGMDPNSLVIIGLDTQDGPEHPLYDDRINLPLDEAMIRNIRKFGVLEVVLVTKIGDSAVVVDGRQRVRCAREASRRNDAEGLPAIQVPCMVKRGDNLTDIMVSANEIRRDDTALVRAKKAQKLVDLGRSMEQVALAFGVTEKYIGDLLKLLELSPEVQAAVERKRLSASAALVLHGLPVEEQNAKLVEVVGEEEVEEEAKPLTPATETAPAAKPKKAKKATAQKMKAALGKKQAPSKRRLRQVSEKLGGAPGVLLAWVLGEFTDKEACKEAPSLSKAILGKDE